MKSFSLIAFLILAAFFGIFAQNQPANIAFLQGTWSGSLAVGKTSLRIVFHVEVAESGVKATMDSPDQGAKGIAATSVTLVGTKVVLDLKLIKGRFEGTLDAGLTRIDGFWSQSGAKLPLVLEKVKPGESAQAGVAADGAARPQTPKPPFPYSVREVTVKGPDGIKLAGSLCAPKGSGPFPAALLVTGSGAQDRDETILGHKPFLVIVDYLARRGIATLRLDDRGVGGSTGDFSAATTYDFALDAEAALAFLRGDASIDPGKIGIIGHSEGGLIAAIEASKNSGLAFAILLAGPGLSGEKLLYLQNATIGKASGMDEAAIGKANAVNASLYAITMGKGEPEALRSKIVDVFLGMLPFGALPEQRAKAEEEGRQAAAQLLSPWLRTFLALDPAPYLAKVKIPLLAMIGSKDLQVPAKENLAAIGAAMKEAGNSSYLSIELPGLNHLFQTAGSGLPAEYGTIEESFSPKALAVLGDWLISVTRR